MCSRIRRPRTSARAICGTYEDASVSSPHWRRAASPARDSVVVDNIKIAFQQLNGRKDGGARRYCRCSRGRRVIARWRDMSGGKLRARGGKRKRAVAPAAEATGVNEVDRRGCLRGRGRRRRHRSALARTCRSCWGGGRVGPLVLKSVLSAYVSIRFATSLIVLVPAD